MPKKRKYLPYGLTKKEKADPVLKRKLASCIKQVEKKSCPKSAKKDGKYDYRKCLANPVAVCRASIYGKKGSNPDRFYRLGTKVKVGKTQKGIVKDFITEPSGKRYYKILIPGKGYKIVHTSKIKKL